MKIRIIAVILLLMLFVMPVAAQINLGARAGINLATISESDDLGGDFKIRPGLNLGAVAEYMVMDPLGIQVEFLIDQFGAVYKEKGTFDWGSIDEKTKVRANVLSIPIMAKYTYPLDEQMTLYGLLGPNLGLLLFGKAKGEEKVWDVKIDEPITDTCKRFDLGVVLGAGVQMPFNNYNVFVDLRYILGLTNDFKKGGYLGDGDFVFKNRVLSLNFGIRGLLNFE